MLSNKHWCVFFIKVAWGLARHCSIWGRWWVIVLESLALGFGFFYFSLFFLFLSIITLSLSQPIRVLAFAFPILSPLTLWDSEWLRGSVVLSCLLGSTTNEKKHLLELLKKQHSAVRTWDNTAIIIFAWLGLKQWSLPLTRQRNYLSSGIKILCYTDFPSCWWFEPDVYQTMRSLWFT